MHTSHTQLSVLRLFHSLLSDASLRKDPSAREALLLATTVVRGLFRKMAGAAGAAGGKGALVAHPQQPQQQQQQQGGPPRDQEAEQQQQQQHADPAAAAARESRRQSAVAGMLCVELLFWKHTHTCDQINREYSLRDEDRLEAGGGGGGGGGSRGRKGGE
jgi:hypothetical protein